MKHKLTSPPAIIAIVLTSLFVLSLYLRIHLGYSTIFINNSTVWFRETDAYFYLRYIENMVANFPHYNIFDPMMLYPGGGGLGRPFFTWLIAGISLIVGHGSPTLHTISTVAAYIPPILGALTIIPVYFIGKELWNRWAGAIAAALLIILPGEFLHRSLLGFTDHHVAEVLFTATAAMFFIMAMKRAREREITFRLSRNWSVVRKPLIYALLSGLFLGIYLLTWGGGLMFAFIMFSYLVIQFIVDHFRKKPTSYLCVVSVPLFLITTLVYIPGVHGRIDIFTGLALAAAVAVPVALNLISRFLHSKNWRSIYYPLTLLVLFVLGLSAVRLIDPVLFASLSSSFSFMSPSSAMRTVMEAAPILFPQGHFTLSVLWNHFTTSFFISLVSFGVLIYTTIRERNAIMPFFLLWSLVILIATFGQRRFEYYLVVNVALLTGYLSWKILDLVGLRKLLVASKQVVSSARTFKKRKRNKRTSTLPRPVLARVIVVGVAMFFLVFFPNIRPAGSLASSPSIVYNSMATGWYESCLWLKDNTPEPFGNPGLYYQLYPSSRYDFAYPDGFYGVLSWWDYGYFITQIGHRVPNANPSQGGADEAAIFFTAQNETEANEMADARMSKYIMIDNDMATGKFYAMVEWAGKDMSDFYEVAYVPNQDGTQLSPMVLYYPAYYQSAAIRLYNFDGRAVNVTASVVVLLQDQVGSSGNPYKRVVGAWSFDTYEEAEAYIAEQGEGDYHIVSADPYTSCVPLEAMSDYELVYSSSAMVNSMDRVMSGVKIFEYLNVPYSPPPPPVRS